MKSQQIYIIILAFVSIILMIGVLMLGNYAIKSGKIIECFYSATPDMGDPYTSHSVDLPINTTYSCKNMCGSMARCSITGEQCLSDIDCYGCKPIKKPDEKQQQEQDQKKHADIRGQNDAGKLTTQVTPMYSVLTTDIGTQATLINDRFAPPPQYNQGVNTWRETFNVGQELFDKRYNPGSIPYMPTYPDRTTLSGQFIDNGPLASNDFL